MIQLSLHRSPFEVARQALGRVAPVLHEPRAERPRPLLAIFAFPRKNDNDGDHLLINYQDKDLLNQRLSFIQVKKLIDRFPRFQGFLPRVTSRI